MIDILFAIENAVPPEVCDQIIAEHVGSLEKGTVFNNEDSYETDDNIRRSNISFNVTQDARQLMNHWIGVANREMFGVDLSGYTEYQFTQYKGEEQGFFEWHMDYNPRNNLAFDRKLSLIIVLSDPRDYEGGELSLGYYSKPVKPIKGTVIVFPSFLLHKVAEVTKGTRYTLVAWAEGPAWR
jgi:PKHD-type hydroxylase